MHSYHGWRVAVAADACESDTTAWGQAWAASQGRVLVCRKTPRGLKPKTGLSARSEIAKLSEIAIGNRGRCRKVKLRRKMQEGGIAGDCSGL